MVTFTKKMLNDPKNFIILFSTMFFAVHSLYFIHVFSVNTILGDDFLFVPFVKSFVDGESFWTVSPFLQFDIHRLLIPNILTLLSVELTQWNTIYLMMFGWCLIAISTFFIYLMLNKTDSRLRWLIIPISAMLFNPIQYATMLWALPNNSYLLLVVGFVGAIYFLNKLHENKFLLLPAIFFATISTFSTFPGIIIWPIGVISLLSFKKITKTPLILWVFFTMIILSFFFIDYSLPDSSNSFKHTNILDVFWSFFSKGFVNNVSLLEPLEFIVGPIVFFFILFGPVFLKITHKNFSNFIPWIQFGCIGLTLAFGFYMVITFTDNPTLVDSSRYGTYANFPQISALIMITASMLFLYDRFKHDRKKIYILVLLFVLFFGLSSGLAVSYYIGWWHGFHMFEEHTQILNCLTKPNSDFLCFDHLYHDYIAENAKILRELELGPFSEQEPFFDHSNDPLLNFLRVSIVGVPIQIDERDFNEIKQNGTKWDYPTNKILSYTSQLQINLNTVHFNPEIELSLDSGDVYSIKFYDGNELLGRKIIYTENYPQGLVSFNVKVPAEIIETGYDNIRIQPINGDERFSVGHIILK